MQRRLADRVAGWSAVMMLTLTIDPDLFPDPQTAFEWVRDRRGVSELVRALFKRGYLRSSRYVVVVEFHKNGWPHWHLLVESEFIPIEEVRRLWGRLRPEWAGAVADARYPFGIVDYRKKAFADGRHAANYAGKYLTKYPEEGFPEWVLDFPGQIHRYSVSRGFWGDEAGEKPAARAFKRIKHPPECFCESCRCGESPARRGYRRTARELIGACRGRTDLYHVREVRNELGVMVDRVSTFLGSYELDLRELVEAMGIEGCDRSPVVRLREGEVDEFRMVASDVQRGERWERLRRSDFQRWGGSFGGEATENTGFSVPPTEHKKQKKLGVVTCG